MSAPDTSPETLLARSGWVRALALRILRDEGLADDVAQETLLLGLSAPSDAGGRAGWLAGVARNLARRTLRSRERRERRERLALAGAPPPTPAEVLERELARREVVEALLGLREPFRQALLCRYYEDLEPADIARRLGVNASTVRTRLARGHALLREALERKGTGEAGGERRAARALLLVAGRAPRRGATAAPSPSTLAAGSLAMSAKPILLLLGSAAALSLALHLGRGARPGAEPQPHGTPPAGRLAALGTAAGQEPAPPAPERASVAVPGAASAGGPWRLAIPRVPGSIAGRVVGEPDGEPVAGLVVTATPDPGGLAEGFELELEAARAGEARRATTDTSGAFAFEQLAGGPYRLDARRGELAASGFGVATPEGSFVQLALRPPAFAAPVRDLVVRVVDGRGAPVAGARVRVRGSGAAAGRGDGWTQVTGAAGEARFEAIDLERGIVLAEGPDGIARCDLFRPDALEHLVAHEGDGRGGVRDVLVLELAPAGALAGVLRGAEPGTLVQAWARSWPQAAYAATRIEHRVAVDAGGRFHLAGLAAGTYAVTAETPPGRRLELEARPAGPGGAGELQPLEAVVRAGETTTLALALVPGPVLAGRVTGEDGVPLVDARVRAVLSRGLSSDPDHVRRGGVHLWRLDAPHRFDERHPLFARETRTGPDGRYRLDGLPPGAWRVEVLATGWSYDRAHDVVLADGETRELVHQLVRAGGIQGVAWEWATLGLRPAGATGWTIALTAPRRAIAPFTVPGLAPGPWELAALHSDPAVSPTPVATVEVRAGELTWVDLRHASPYAAGGRLLWRGAPVAGAVLDFLGPQVLTDEDGRFTHSFPFPHEGDVTIDLTLPAPPDAVPLRAAVQGMASRAVPWSGDLALPEGALAVRVVDAAGAPLVAELTLRHLVQDQGGLAALGYVGGPSQDEAPASAQPVRFRASHGWDVIVRATGPDGRARFETLPAGRYELHARSGAILLAPRDLELAEGESRELELAPGPGGRLEILVLDEHGRPAPGETVSVGSAERQPSVGGTFRTGAQGSVTIEHLPEGEYHVAVQGRPFAPRWGSGTRALVRTAETAHVELRPD